MKTEFEKWQNQPDFQVLNNDKVQGKGAQIIVFRLHEMTIGLFCIKVRSNKDDGLWKCQQSGDLQTKITAKNYTAPRITSTREFDLCDERQAFPACILHWA